MPSAIDSTAIAENAGDLPKVRRANRKSLPIESYCVSFSNDVERNWTFSLVSMALFASLGAAQTLATRKALTLDSGKQIAAAAEAEAIKNKWNVVIAIVDEGGHLIYLQRMDETQVASADIAPLKAPDGGDVQAALEGVRGSRQVRRRQRTGATGACLPSEGGLPIIGRRQGDRCDRRQRRFVVARRTHRESGARMRRQK